MSTNLDNDVSQGEVSNRRRLSSKSVRIAVIIAAATAAINAIWVIYRMVELDSRVRKASLVSIQIDPSVSLMHIRIAVALLLAALCLWHRRVVSLLMSVVTLIWVLIEHGRWYAWTVSIHREAGVVELGVTHALGLYGASVWNATVMVIVLALVIWEVKTLVAFWMTERHPAKL